MIKIENLVKSYGPRKVLKNVSLHLEKGRILGLAGPNGCGKSTLIKCILGLVLPESGGIQVGGNNILDQFEYRKHLGYMPQNPEFPAHLSIVELFKMVQEIRQEVAVSEKELVSVFDLESIKNQKFGVLSGGTKQKVAACIALMFNPDLLILDEPTVGLDPISSSRFKKLVKERVVGGCSVLLVSHIMSEMEQLVENMIFLLDGQVSFSGSVECLLQRTNSLTLENAVVSQLQEVESV